ncbi:Methyl esterase [Trema orientale]|uniref:(S)-hydroxynitrile lyase n=1 Tax=Trema orientale TaxID=63057 RepID=A0A2P5FZ24_TREOI|nr:Methyl esterase [Trema orientale]
MDQRKHFGQLSFLLLIAFCLSTNIAMKSEPTETGKHFVLVHGSCHGAWSWYKLVALMKASGHKVSALDLGASGVDGRQAKELRSISDYFRLLRDLMAGLAGHERVVLVGHSLGGLAISQAMENFASRISVAVFVTALMPGPSLNVSTLYRESLRKAGAQMDNHYTYENGPNNPPTTFIFGPLFLAAKVYQKSPNEDLALATMLMRPLPLFSEEDMSKELILTKDKYGSVNRVYIISEKDVVVNKDVEQWMLKNNQPNGVVEIRGSDHMVMMSKPIELWNHLQNIAREYY